MVYENKSNVFLKTCNIGGCNLRLTRKININSKTSTLIFTNEVQNCKKPLLVF